MSMTGHCLCGAVRFEADQVETDYHACHCSMCRRWSGGPAMAASVGSLRFEDQEHLGRYASSDWAERGFCRLCGSNLFYRLTSRDHYSVWVGAFDDAAAFRLQGEIFIDDKPAGYAFAGDHPRLTGQQTIASFEQQGDG